MKFYIYESIDIVILNWWVLKQDETIVLKYDTQIFHIFGEDILSL